MLQSGTAPGALQEIPSHLQEEVIVNLKAHWQQGASIDFTALKDVADSSQNQAILALMQLQQCMITLGPFENIAVVPLNIAEIGHRGTTSVSETKIAANAPEPSIGIIHGPSSSVSSSSISIIPTGTSSGAQYARPLEQLLSRVLPDSASSARK